MSQEKRWCRASISRTPSLRLAVSASCPARTSQSADRWNANWARILANGSRLSWPRDPVSTNHSSPQLALDEHPAGGGDEGVAGAQVPRVQGGAGGAEAFPPTHMFKHLQTLSIVIDNYIYNLYGYRYIYYVSPQVQTRLVQTKTDQGPELDIHLGPNLSTQYITA